MKSLFCYREAVPKTEMENDDSDSKISSGSLASFYDVAVMEDTKPDEQIDETDLSPQSEDPPQTRTTWYDQSKEQPQNNLNSSPSPDSDLPPAASSEQQEFPIYSSPLPVCSQPRPEPGQTEKPQPSRPAPTAPVRPAPSSPSGKPAAPPPRPLQPPVKGDSISFNSRDEVRISELVLSGFILNMT